MARTNGPFGPPGARAPLRRRPGDDAFGAPPVGGHAPAQWPPQAFPDQGQGGQGYHFPPPEPDPNYGYQQQLVAHPQWEQQADQRAYDLGNYPPVEAQSYSDPGPFQQHHQQAYAEDADYRDEFFDDEEPRRGRRWIFIAAALVGAIGVGGALAYTYRSLIAPGGRVPLVKAEPNVKVKPADKKMPSRVEEAAAKKAEPQAQEEPSDEEKNLGPRKVPTIPIGPQPAQVAPPAMAAVPGITLHGLQPPEPAPQAQPKAAPPPKGRVTIGERPPVPADELEAPPAEAKRPPAASPAVAKAPSAKLTVPPPASTGQGFVTVVASKKSSVDALKVYADLQQKFGDLLADRTPAVQESDQSARGLGMMYRLVVGPPGSREAASGLCNQLKAAGQDCWVMAY